MCRDMICMFFAFVVDSEEEAKKKIYNISCERYFGFGCEIDEETSNKLEGLCIFIFIVGFNLLSMIFHLGIGSFLFKILCLFFFF